MKQIKGGGNGKSLIALLINVMKLKGKVVAS